MPLAIVLLVVGVILLLVDILVASLGWLLWVGIVLAIVGLVLLVLDRTGRPVGRRRSGL